MKEIRCEPPEPRERLVVANISGGKDSTALSLWLREQGIEHRRVFADTGWEHPVTYEYLDYLREKLGPIDVVRSKVGGMEDWIRKKSMFPHRIKRWCTSELKVKPIRTYMEEVDPVWRAVTALGIRAAESQARSKLDEWEHDANAMERWVWRPLIDWTLSDVVDIHTRHGVRPNPLYLQGAERVGCFPCIYARKSEIRLVADIMPSRIDTIREMEEDLEAARQERLASDEEYAKLAAENGHQKRSYFSVNKDFMPIDEVVRWSRTSRGGRQFELFDTGEPDAGCMRWGLCDHGSQE